MKKILITGGAGYIGSHTAVELWKAGMEPIILDDLSNSYASVIDRLEEITGKRFAFYQGDCNKKSLLKSIADKHKIEGVIHFAAFKAVGESTAQPLKYYRNNVGSLMVLLQFMQERGIRDLVFFIFLYGVWAAGRAAGDRIHAKKRSRESLWQHKENL